VIIEKIELENFLSHKRSTVELGRGVIALVGPNGAGKTSVIDAITYALADEHSRDPRGRKEPVIRLGSLSARISLVFSTGGREYRIDKRIHKSATTEASLYTTTTGGLRVIARGVSSVRAELARILGMDPKLLVKLQVTRQGELEDILVRSDRIDLIDTILGIKNIEKTYESLRNIIRVFEREYDELKGRLEGLKQSYSLLPEYEKKAKEIETKLASTLTSLRRLEEEIEEIEEKYNELEKKINTKKVLQQRVDDLRKEVEEFEQALEERREKLREASKASEQARKLSYIEEVVDTLEEAYRIDIELSSIENQLKKLTKSIESRRKRIEELREVAKDYSFLKSLEREKEELEEKYNEYKDAINKLNLIDREISSLKKEEPILRRRLLNVVEEVTGSRKELDKPEKFQELLEEIHREVEEKLEAIDKQLREYRERVTEYQSKIRQLEDYLEIITGSRRECPVCRRPLREEDWRNLLQVLKHEKEKHLDELLRLEDRVRELEEQQERYREYEEKLRKKQLETARIVEKLVAVASRVAELEEEKNKLNTKLLHLLVAKKEYESIEEKIKELKKRGVEEAYARLSAEEGELRREEEERREYEKKFSEKIRKLEELLGKLGIEREKILEELRKARLLYREYQEYKSRAQLLPVLEREVYSLEVAIAEKKKEYNNYIEELSRLEDIESEYVKTKSKYEEMRAERESMINTVGRLRGELEFVKNEIQRLRQLGDEVKQLETRLSKLEHTVSVLKSIREVLAKDKLPRLIRARAKNLLEYHIQEILQEFQIEFTAVQLDEDFGVTLLTREGPKTVSMLSGGERTALAIAYRLALARVVGRKLESLILDEPTVHLDEDRRKELIDIIRYASSVTGLDQLIVVTHDREVEDAADIVLEISKKDGVSIVSRKEGISFS